MCDSTFHKFYFCMIYVAIHLVKKILRIVAIGNVWQFDTSFAMQWQTVTWGMSQFKKRQGWLSLIIYLYHWNLHNISTTQLIHSYVSSSCFSVCHYVRETLMRKNNMDIIGNDMKIMDNFLESVIDKILGSGLSISLPERRAR